ncbi:MAG: aldo/keto reductase [Bryobacterales bacterium]|nr:aldo/keto reductase [Bryobacterales bacterium]MBV9401033.1 aldo/keto reductase [Bryobacterales bacterium]
MQYARLGDTGLIVSRLAFGAMTFGTSDGIFAAVSKVAGQDLANQLVHKALDAGINHFNTADVYTAGQSETMLGKALGARRQDVVISTKVGFRTGPALVHQGLSRHHILASAEDSLRRLGTDYIDVYLVHRPDLFTPIEETLEALDTLARTGKVRYVGFSNWNAWRAAKAVGLQIQNGWARFRAAEMYYSLVGRDVEQEIVPFAQDAGIGILAWSPLAGGFLSGKYSRENPQGDGGRLAAIDFIPRDQEKSYNAIERLRTIASARGESVAQIALAWLLAKPAVSSILLGANKVSQLEDNLGAADLSLSSEEIASLDELTAPALVYPNWFAARAAVDVPVRDALTGQKEIQTGA